MKEATIISIRIPKEIKSRMRELGIKPSDAAREGIDMEIRRHELSRNTLCIIERNIFISLLGALFGDNPV